ncbi:hypothetical protein SKAU_G00083720 [Synaphobranchus kaupii]|uniref:Uncharacterized protein n=1 Tax=Synaphobranchus kaupii TaxID=118154 RepID=A0A9Q1J5G0_SYNKA|nr:hypothetical protein SKAU_G00083720 [Synaphobranchus kaupii]
MGRGQGESTGPWRTEAGRDQRLAQRGEEDVFAGRDAVNKADSRSAAPEPLCCRLSSAAVQTSTFGLLLARHARRAQTRHSLFMGSRAAGLPHSQRLSFRMQVNSHSVKTLHKSSTYCERLHGCVSFLQERELLGTAPAQRRHAALQAGVLQSSARRGFWHLFRKVGWFTRRPNMDDLMTPVEEVALRTEPFISLLRFAPALQTRETLQDFVSLPTMNHSE